MRIFIVTALLVVGLGLFAVLYLRANLDKLPQDSLAGRASQALQNELPEPAPRIPLDYHILEDQGGVPQAEAEQAGLISDDYAYLSAIGPINLSQGVEPVSGITVRGRAYDFCYSFASLPMPEQYAEFNINGDWDELHFGFGFDDSHPSDPKDQWAIELEIQGDGKAIFGPQIVKPTGEVIFNMADVKGVRRLNFVSRRIGSKNTFAPVLIDPFVIKVAGAAE